MSKTFKSAQSPQIELNLELKAWLQPLNDKYNHDLTLDKHNVTALMVKRYTYELDWYNVCEWSLCVSEFTHLSSTETDELIYFWPSFWPISNQFRLTTELGIFHK